MKKYLCFFLFLPFSLSALCQNNDSPENWYLADFDQDSVIGISYQKAQSLIQGKSKKKIRVAIIDAGFDTRHPALRNYIWTNIKEIPNNNIDDDKNGYIDDINGWNFLGNQKINILYANTDITRLLRCYSKKFEGDLSNFGLSTNEYRKYLSLKEKYNSELKKSLDDLEQNRKLYNAFLKADSTVKHVLKKQDYSISDVFSIESTDEEILKSKNNIIALSSIGYSFEKLKYLIKYYTNTINYEYNLDSDEREKIGDDTRKFKDRFYGNNRLYEEEFSDAYTHGTQVASIITSIVQDTSMVELMLIRGSTGIGGGLDKDWANSIIYAVDNGADIINISLAGMYTDDKKALDFAVKYAQKKRVLIINASGNDAVNSDSIPYYPIPNYGKNNKKLNPYWIEVGASGKDLKTLVASFSNYGKESVDIFAPGVDMKVAIPNSKYDISSGTSLAAPVITAIAAITWSLFPDLSVSKVKNLLLESGRDFSNTMVFGMKNQSLFGSLCRVGKIVNLYQVLSLATNKYEL